MWSSIGTSRDRMSRSSARASEAKSECRLQLSPSVVDLQVHLGVRCLRGAGAFLVPQTVSDSSMGGSKLSNVSKLRPLRSEWSVVSEWALSGQPLSFRRPGEETQVLGTCMSLSATPRSGVCCNLRGVRDRLGCPCTVSQPGAVVRSHVCGIRHGAR